MEENSYCYTFQEQKYPSGLLDKSIDATYVINLRANGRYESILKEIDEYTPTRIIYIVFNDGFKKCKKNIPQSTTPTSALDLVDATLQIYKHANQMNYKNILILEDDCFFDKKIQDKKVLNDLTTFFINHKETSFTYRIGYIPVLAIPFLTHLCYGLYGGLHAYVISESARQSILTKDQFTIKDIDEHVQFFTTQYAYYMPLAYQLFPATENQQVWGANSQVLPSFITRFIAQIAIYNGNLLNLDKSAYPGYTIMCIISRILFCILILLALFIIYKGVQYSPLVIKQVLKLFKLPL